MFNLDTLCILLLFVIVIIPAKAQEYPLLYENDFEAEQGALDFEFTDPGVWKINDSLGNKSLDLIGLSNYKLPVSSPYNIAILKKVKVSNFILEARIKQTGREYPHRDLCIFFAIKDPSNYYYLHIASEADPNSHNIFLVNDEPQKAIASKTNSGIIWGDDWHQVRIEHLVKTGSIKVYFDDMENPIMEAKDDHFSFGYVGFGSFDDVGKFDNIKIWGDSFNDSPHFFR
ncbi:hypothetical protein [Flagellimonas sp.]|uniref:hypothetical protein n=1 Tax=Flagellimonas sp. TaxID=2058762 RepID=UPI003BAE5F12